MKRFALILFAAAFGGFIGVHASILHTSFFPVCGEDCFYDRFINLIMWICGGAAFFAIATWITTQKMFPSPGRIIIGGICLSLLLLAPTFAIYIHDLRKDHELLSEIAPVRPNPYYFHMAIATRPVGPIKQWERCLIGSINCESEPRDAEFLCKNGVLSIKEADWPAFTLIPEENFPGAPPLQTIKLCSSTARKDVP